MDIQEIKQDACQAAAQWQDALAAAARIDAGDLAAGLGRWWLERAGGEIVLSPVAARFLGTPPRPTRAERLDRKSVV